MSTNAAADLIKAINEKKWADAKRIVQTETKTKLVMYTGEGGKNALHWACVHNAPVLFIKLLLSIANDDVLTTVEKGGRTPLHYAVRYSYDEVVLSILRACPVASNIEDMRGQTALDWARSRERSPEVIRRLEVAQEIDEIQESAYATLLNGNMAAAIELESTLVDFNENSNKSLFNRSTAYLLSGRINDALADINSCLAINPNFTAAYTRKGVLLTINSQFDDAIQTYRIGLEKFPQDEDMSIGLRYTERQKQLRQEEAELSDRNRETETEMEMLRREHELAIHENKKLSQTVEALNRRLEKLEKFNKHLKTKEELLSLTPSTKCRKSLDKTSPATPSTKLRLSFESDRGRNSAEKTSILVKNSPLRSP